MRVVKQPDMSGSVATSALVAPGRSSVPAGRRTRDAGGRALARRSARDDRQLRAAAKTDVWVLVQAPYAGGDRLRVVSQPVSSVGRQPQTPTPGGQLLTHLYDEMRSFHQLPSRFNSPRDLLRHATAPVRPAPS